MVITSLRKNQKKSIIGIYYVICNLLFLMLITRFIFPLYQMKLSNKWNLWGKTIADIKHEKIKCNASMLNLSYINCRLSENKLQVDIINLTADWRLSLFFKITLHMLHSSWFYPFCYLLHVPGLTLTPHFLWNNWEISRREQKIRIFPNNLTLRSLYLRIRA